MNKKTLAAMISLAVILLAVLAACSSEPEPDSATLEVTSGKDPNASVSGAVTYRERLALSEGARLVVEIRDTSYADASAPLIARQTITSPGQVPIKFNAGYNRDDIDSRNTYSISADIIESDGRLAFTNDTAYDVITRGNPTKVDMLLVLVQPPPELVPEGASASDIRSWVETPARIVRANLIPNEPELYLRVEYLQSTIEGCARPGSQELEVDGYEINVRLTLMQPPPTEWAIPCHEQVVQLDGVEPIDKTLEPGHTYRVKVNGLETTTFTVPKPSLGHTFIAESPIESIEVTETKEAQLRYQLRVVSGMPRGSGCSQFNGYEIRRVGDNKIDVSVTHHQVADPSVICTADFPIIKSIFPLESYFERGVEYTLTVNSDTTTTFVGR